MLRLPSLKICTVLLGLLFVYDIFFVFITPLFMPGGKSVMVEVRLILSLIFGYFFFISLSFILSFLSSFLVYFTLSLSLSLCVHHTIPLFMRRGKMVMVEVKFCVLFYFFFYPFLSFYLFISLSLSLSLYHSAEVFKTQAISSLIILITLTI